jgi:hypothetical protein
MQMLPTVACSSLTCVKVSATKAGRGDWTLGRKAFVKWAAPNEFDSYLAKLWVL